MLRNICQLLLIRKQILSSENSVNIISQQNVSNTEDLVPIKILSNENSVDSVLSSQQNIPNTEDRPSLVPINSILEPLEPEKRLQQEKTPAKKKASNDGNPKKSKKSHKQVINRSEMKKVQKR